ncbi:hypothetical protein [Bordetella bronchiseptica]|uniref:hypothetical protein n=1 Tax=Bordetella bronchiseptica TaxID=518 RepID=UPI000FD77FB5|nr:hypothetical protein [Bordetella bronchiseptica]
MKYRAWLFLVTGTLVGCGTTWHNANISDPSILARQLAIDEGYCTRVAAGAAPMPETRLDTSSQQSYAVSGKTTTLGPNGPQTSFHSGTITPTNNFGSGFSSGLSQGAALGAAIRARRERDAVIKGCMFNLGWSDTAIPVSARATSQPTTPSTRPPAAPATLSRGDAGMAAPKHENSANLSCDQWVNDVAVAVDSAQANGMKREDLVRASQGYLGTVNASGRERLIFAYIIRARYQISSTELSSEDFPRYIRWECDKGWAGIGLGQS